MIYLAPYNMFSESAKALAKNLNVLRIKKQRSLLQNSTVINWGNTNKNWVTRSGLSPLIINHPANVKCAVNKLSCYSILKTNGVLTVTHTLNPTEAIQWQLEGHSVYGRDKIESYGGDGITVYKSTDALGKHKFYTKQIKGKEYRVHIAFNKLIDYTQKKKRLDTEVNDDIKNFNNGWVYCRENVLLPVNVAIESAKAIKVLGLHFGAVDIILDKDNNAFVLEVNTAPGLEGTTLDKYTNAFKERFR